ncbi:hypothetical protein ABT168_25945 [Streptomyces sp. NPDC001793]|uniref:hypothetical protein n=1 Tax=Streptomyces sp. NPDC001793 TaxID=3154657 RepID=UPI003316FA6C
MRVEQDGPFTLIAGPCVIESRDAALRHAERIAAIAERVRHLHGVRHARRVPERFQRAARWPGPGPNR